jgi:hypothetical protein
VTPVSNDIGKGSLFVFANQHASGNSYELIRQVFRGNSRFSDYAACTNRFGLKPELREAFSPERESNRRHCRNDGAEVHTGTYADTKTKARRKPQFSGRPLRRP